jgi:hypothetical protein
MLCHATRLPSVGLQPPKAICVRVRQRSLPVGHWSAEEILLLDVASLSLTGMTALVWPPLSDNALSL